MARVPRRVGIGVELLGQDNVERGFFFGLAHRGAFDALAVIDKPARQRPTVRRIFSLDQHDAVEELDNDIDGEKRITKFLAHRDPYLDSAQHAR